MSINKQNASIPRRASAFPISPDDERLLESFTTVLSQSNVYTIRQRPVVRDGCCPYCWILCDQTLCEQKNLYQIFAGMDDKDATKTVMVGMESSFCCTRTCCNPHHSLNIALKEADGSDERWGKALTFSMFDDKKAGKGDQKPLDAGPTFVTMERPGCMCNCFKAPKPCLCCPTFFEMCSENATLHVGDIGGEPGNTSKTAKRKPILNLRQATVFENDGSCFHPKIKVIYNGKKDTAFSITGPCCFGGWSEMCFDSKYVAVRKDGSVVGQFSKLHPEMNNLCNMARELATDYDRFQVTMTPELDPDAQAAMLGTSFLVDYMFFENDRGKCQFPEPSYCVCTISQCYLCGLICPFNVYLPNPVGIALQALKGA
jgi:hypothetical protein